MTSTIVNGFLHVGQSTCGYKGGTTKSDSEGMEDLANALECDQINYSGAIIFWSYIVFALFFTALVVSTLIDIEPNKAPRTRRQQRDVVLFSGLATISFATLSINMLNVLIQSFNTWSGRHQRNYGNLIRSIWKWSSTSTLFRDFGEAVVKNNARYLWSEAALLTTFIVCLFMGIEGSRRQMPRLWAFFCLSQILPISLAQNLFYVALLRLGNESSSGKIPSTVLRRSIYLTGAYCGILFIFPVTAGSAWLMPCILFSRVLLFAPLFARTREPERVSQKDLNYAEIKDSGFKTSIAFLTLPCLITQICVAVIGQRDFSKVGWALFEHPAVSSFGCDFIISLISGAMWAGESRHIAERPREGQKML